MRKLKFDRNRYGNGLLIDAADMSTFDGSIVEAVPDFHVIGIIEAGGGNMRIGDHRVKVQPGTVITITPGMPVDLSACWFDRATWIFFEAGFLDILFEEPHFTYKLTSSTIRERLLPFVRANGPFRRALIWPARS